MVQMPYNFAQGRGSLSQFSWDSAFWVFNFVSNYVYPRYNIMIDDVKKVQSELEGLYLAQQKDIEEKALQRSKTSKREAVEYLNNYSTEMADLTITKWKKLGEHLILKFIDGISKNEFYKFVNLGYSNEFKKMIVESDGTKLKMRKLPSETEAEFKQNIQSAEKFLAEKNYAKAKSSLEKALEIMPKDEVTKQKINKLDEMLKKMEEMHNSLF